MNKYMNKYNVYIYIYIHRYILYVSMYTIYLGGDLVGTLARSPHRAKKNQEGSAPAAFLAISFVCLPAPRNFMTSEPNPKP